MCKGLRGFNEAVIVLFDVKYKDLDALIYYIYNGEVNIHHNDLQSFIDVS